MLPTILSDDRLSLRSGTKRDTMVMEVIIEKTTSNIRDILFYNSKVYIHHNYHYEEPDLLSHLDYQLVKQTVSNLVKSSTTQYITEITDSHDIVAFLMIMINHQIGMRLKNNRGIFRITENNIIQADRQPINAEWCCQYIGSYIAYDAANNILLENDLKTPNIVRHEALQLDYYLHITSPIRRLVDNINMILFQQQFGLHNYSFIANQFVEKWISNIGIVFINDQTTTIRRLQNKCDIINIMKDMTSAEGTIIGKDSNMIHIYFHSIRKIFTTSFLSTTEDKLVLSKTYRFCIHFFEDEDKMKKKIRLTLL
jgi:exoribonuclease R